jgi:hypothetical protein
MEQIKMQSSILIVITILVEWNIEKEIE